MKKWSLPQILAHLHDEMEQKLGFARRSLANPDAKGDASESAWCAFLAGYLPGRYKVSAGYVVDSLGNFSDQLDVVVFDRQYSPFILSFEGQAVVPAESVYAVFEAKQTLNASLLAYAQGKVESVRKLHRTSLPIPHAGGTYDPKKPQRILGGILAFESDWTPPLGQPLLNALATCADNRRLELGCAAAHGMFQHDSDGGYSITIGNKPVTRFIFELIARLQAMATVPMIDVRAYAKWLGTS